MKKLPFNRLPLGNGFYVKKITRIEPTKNPIKPPKSEPIEILEKLDLTAVKGLGPKTLERLEELKVYTLKDLKNLDLSEFKPKIKSILLALLE